MFFQKSEDRQGGDGLSRAGFSNQGDGLGTFDLKTDSLDQSGFRCTFPAASDVIVDPAAQPINTEKRRYFSCYVRQGSNSLLTV